MESQSQDDRMYRGYMKAGVGATLLLLAFIALIVMCASCSTGYHIGTNPDKKSNMVHWKADRLEKKAGKNKQKEFNKEKANVEKN